jgi:hypothetical protein
MIAPCVPALTRSTLDSTVETLKVATKASTSYWTGAVRRRATPAELAAEALKWWTAMTDRKPPQWATPHEIVFETAITRLRDFSQGSTDDVVPTLVLPPQAGHDSCIVDFSPVQSQMQVVRAAGLTRLYSMDWIGATQATKNTTVDDYLVDLDRALDHIAPDGGKVNLVGGLPGRLARDDLRGASPRAREHADHRGRPDRLPRRGGDRPLRRADRRQAAGSVLL